MRFSLEAGCSRLAEAQSFYTPVRVCLYISFLLTLRCGGGPCLAQVWWFLHVVRGRVADLQSLSFRRQKRDAPCVCVLVITSPCLAAMKWVAKKAEGEDEPAKAQLTHRQGRAWRLQPPP